MPESGFLISCASMSAERGDRAGRAAMGQLPVHFFGNCTFLQHYCHRRRRSAGSGATKTSTIVPIAGPRRGNIDLIAVDGRRLLSASATRAENRRAERQEVGEPGAQQRAAPHVEEISRAAILTSITTPWTSTASSGCASALSTSAASGPASMMGVTSCRLPAIADSKARGEQAAARPRSSLVTSSRRSAGRARRLGISRQMFAGVAQPGAGPELPTSQSEMLAAPPRGVRQRRLEPRGAAVLRARARSRRRARARRSPRARSSRRAAPEAASMARRPRALAQSPLTTTGMRDRVDDLARPPPSRRARCRTARGCGREP